MAVMLERWNDDKMDGLAAMVDRIDQGLREQRGDLREQREDLREQRQELHQHRREMKEGFETLHRTLIQTTVAVFTGYILGFAALVGLIATQL
jgi:phosphoglycerate-specific signal transduction histidine kinase